MRSLHRLLLLLVAAVLLAGSVAPAQADAAKAKKRASACQKAKAKAKRKPTAARKRAVKRACRKAPAKKRRPSSSTGSDTTTTPDTSTGTTAPPASASALEQGVVDCANRERAARGIAALAIDPALTRAARAHAADMADRGYFDHDTPEGRSPWDRIKAALDGALPFRAMGENIAMGYRDAEATCDGWMNSPGHKRNILDPDFTLIGAGWVDGYAVQDFGDR